jgi:hypothetical protein
MRNSKRWNGGNFKVAAVSLTLLGLAGGWAQQASAGCGQYQASKSGSLQKESASEANRPGFIRTGFLKVADAENAPEWSHESEPAITGLWYFNYIAEGDDSLNIPDGAIVDGGNTTWYADGNELTSSAMRAPDTGSICLGVWKKTGERTYELNHIGLSWDPVKNVFAGPAFIKQHVTLDKSGNKYSGTFQITQFAADGKTVEVQIKGHIKATRVTIETDTQA